MPQSAPMLKVALVELVSGDARGTATVPKALYRMAWAALRDVGGGRVPEAGAERELVQELLVNLLTRRQEKGAAMVREWEAMAPGAFAVYVKRSLRNLAVERNPTWNARRGLRDQVKAVLAAGVPAAGEFPATLEVNGRFERKLVAAACAAAVATGTAPEVKALTSRLASVFLAGDVVAAEAEVEALAGETPDASEVLAAQRAGEAIVETFLAEEGEAGRKVLALRKYGFKEMAKRLGTALATAHARFVRVEQRLKCIAERVGGDRAAVERALEVLGAP